MGDHKKGRADGARSRWFIGGFEAILTRYIEKDLTLVALANLTDVDLKRITEHTAKLLRDEWHYKVPPP
jgi:hypothetical protein